jgi:hypothetical protein
VDRTATPEELSEFARDHLLYEVAMVARLVDRFRRHRELLDATPRPQGQLADELFDLAGRNADIESFGIHVRALVDFLFAGRDKKDVIAADYFDDQLEWSRVRGKMPAELRDVNARVGAEIAHLSVTRPTPAKAWMYEAVWPALADVLRRFVDNARADRLDAESRERARDWLDVQRTAKPVKPPGAPRLASYGATEYRGPIEFVESSPGTATYPLKPEPPIYEE